MYLDNRRPPNLLAIAIVCFVVAAVLFFLLASQAGAAPLTGGRIITERGVVTNFDTYPDGVRHYVAIRTANGNVAGAITYRVFRPGQRITVRGRLFGREIVRPAIW